jgi:hypothetical protein
VGSKQAYGLLAEKYCPGVYRNCGPVFWCFCVRLCCHRYRNVEILSFVNRVTQLLTGFLKARKISKSFFSCLSLRVCLPMEHLGSHLKDFNKNLYMWIFRKSVEKSQVSLKWGKFKGYFALRQIYIFDLIWPSSSWNEKYFRQKS